MLGSNYLDSKSSGFFPFIIILQKPPSSTIVLPPVGEFAKFSVLQPKREAVPKINKLNTLRDFRKGG